MLLLWEYIVDLVEIILFYILINNKLTKKELPYRKIIVSAYFIFESSFVFWANRANISPLVIVPSCFILQIICCILLFRYEITAIILWCIAFICVTISADALTVIIPINLFHIDVSSTLYGGSLRVPFTIVYLSIIAIMVIFLLCINERTFKLPLYDRIFLLSITLLCVFIEEIILLHQMSTQLGTFISDNIFLYIVFFLVMLLFIAFILYSYRLGNQNHKNNALIEELTIIQMEKKHYDGLIQSSERTRILRHDMKNHLQMIDQFLDNGDIENAKNYLKNIYEESLETSTVTVNTGHPIVDCIITNKLQLCSNANISTKYTIHIPSELPMNNIEICSLLGNLFDNAIESCIKIDNTEERYISFCMKLYNEMLSIEIKNSSNGYYQKTSIGDFVSTKNKEKKNDTATHGIGLKRINSIVSTHQGFTTIDAEPTHFIVSILIPLNTEEN